MSAVRSPRASRGAVHRAARLRAPGEVIETGAAVSANRSTPTGALVPGVPGGVPGRRGEHVGARVKPRRRDVSTTAPTQASARRPQAVEPIGDPARGRIVDRRRRGMVGPNSAPSAGLVIAIPGGVLSTICRRGSLVASFPLGSRPWASGCGRRRTGPRGVAVQTSNRQLGGRAERRPVHVELPGDREVLVISIDRDQDRARQRRSMPTSPCSPAAACCRPSAPLSSQTSMGLLVASFPDGSRATAVRTCGTVAEGRGVPVHRYRAAGWTRRRAPRPRGAAP